MDLTLALVLTAGGATATAAVITGLIAMAKNLAVIGPRIDDGNEPTVAFVLAAVVVILAYVSVGVINPGSGFAAFLAWYGIAQIAMGTHDTVAGLTSDE